MSPSTLASHTVAVLHAPKDLRVEQRNVWPPPKGQAQVAIASTGLCGSDLHYYINGRNGDFAVRSPLILGHESAGTITAVGPGVNHLFVGQRVAIEAGIMCRTCPPCLAGRYNLCKSMRFCSSASVFPHLNGTLQERFNHPAHVLHPLADTCSFDRAALAEPLSVLIHASRRAALVSTHSVLVCGVGAIGLLACALAKARGVSRVVAVDINAPRLEFAHSNGFADEVFCFPAPDRAASTTPDDPLQRAKNAAAAALKAFNAPDGFDVVYECTGAEPVIQMCIHTATPGGKVMLIGMGSRNVLLPLSAAALREVDILGSFRYANTYPEALALLASDALPNVDAIITHRVSLEDAPRAFEMMARGTDSQGGLVLKVMVDSAPPVTNES